MTAPSYKAALVWSLFILTVCGSAALASAGSGGLPGSRHVGRGIASLPSIGGPHRRNQPRHALTCSVPPTPPPGTSRSGQYYSCYISGPTGDVIAFTVFEPSTLTGGATYPLILHSHGFGGSRETSPGLFTPLLSGGYGVVSVDERGHGESTGTIRVMDPDAEGQDWLGLLSWLESNLSWLAYGPSVDGKNPHSLQLGAVGGSYGGGYQLTLADIDPEHRMVAIAPQITWNDLDYSLFPNFTIKFSWDMFLFAAGEGAGNGFNRFNLDPFIVRTFLFDLLANAPDAYALDFFGYHSNRYFCDGEAIQTNGGPGTHPMYAPIHPSKVHALLFNGMRDTLFNFGEAYSNYACLAAAGGDVRLLSYQYGHNTLGFVPDPGEVFQPPGNADSQNCGSINADAAMLAFFNQHLKGIPGAANGIPKICISLSGSDAVVVNHVTRGRAGQAFKVPPIAVVAGGPLDVPVAVDFGPITGSAGNVIAGIPHLYVNVRTKHPSLGEPFVYVGVGQMHASAPGIWDLVDNQVTPLRGTGAFDVDLVGVSQRLLTGDRLGLLIYGNHDQFTFAGSIQKWPPPAVVPVTVSGRVWIPLVGPLHNGP
jgi:ABC-2 type transport system ATP-binding protein